MGDAGGPLTKASVPRGIPRDWYHRNPCHRCGTCTSRACFVHNRDGGRGEVHICWRGCDGLPPTLLRWAA